MNTTSGSPNSDPLLLQKPSLCAELLSGAMAFIPVAITTAYLYGVPLITPRQLGWPVVLGWCQLITGMSSATLWVASARRMLQTRVLNTAAGALTGAAIAYGAGTISIPMGVNSFADQLAQVLPKVGFASGCILSVGVFIELLFFRFHTSAARQRMDATVRLHYLNRSCLIGQVHQGSKVMMYVLLIAGAAMFVASLVLGIRLNRSLNSRPQ